MAARNFSSCCRACRWKWRWSAPTISCGLAAYPEHARTHDELVRCCDEALYEAKRRGRNRCEVFHAEHPALK